MSKDNYSLVLPGFQRCNRCKTVFPHTFEYFSKSRNKLRTTCRQCYNKSVKKRRKIPGVVEQANAKRREKRNDPILGASIKEYERAYRLSHPDLYRECDHKRRQTEPDKEKHRQRSRDYYWKHHEAIRANPRKHSISQTKRRAKIRGLPYSWSGDDWKRCLEYWGNKCCICGQEASDTHFLAQEHWIAVKDNRADNPGTVPWNMLPMCHSYRGRGAKPGCNNSKWAHDPIKWLRSKYPDEADAIIKRIFDYFEWIKTHS